MKIVKIKFDTAHIIGTTDDGRELRQSLLYYPRLYHATPEQRKQYTINAFGIRWDNLDEDMSFDSFEYDNPEPTSLSRFFLMHDEINASAVARKAGISQSLLAQYVKGTKNPSAERKAQLLTIIHNIGRNLQQTKF